jgi:hypothetical protein
MSLTSDDEPRDADEDWVPQHESDHMKQHALEELRLAHARDTTSDPERWVNAGMAIAYAILALHAETRDLRAAIETRNRMR